VFIQHLPHKKYFISSPFPGLKLAHHHLSLILLYNTVISPLHATDALLLYRSHSTGKNTANLLSFTHYQTAAIQYKDFHLPRLP